ncbi:MAG: hypothetical protein EXX96DRAFT_481652 [Benjaminiella poitrasii]|nr:MAG: hypothetical protein EXX96DRAFT_481652 [Benjaminiella poitrasii]
MTFGSDLKDQIPSILKYVGDGIQSLHQFRNFIKDRSTIERDYAQKLESLTRKYKTGHTRRFIHTSSNSADGHQDEWDWENTSSTTSSAWTHLLDQTALVAKGRYRFVDDLNNVVVDSLRSVATRKEDSRKKKLKSERDKSYSEKDKAKQAYDEACVEIENIKTKLNKSGEKEKLQRQLDAAYLNRDNKKNLYLLSIAVANAERDKYFQADTPTLADDTIRKCHDDTLASVEKLDPSVDAALFTQSALTDSDSSEKAANVTFAFIPWNGGANAAETIIDRDDTLVSSEAAVIYLNNKLVKDRKLLNSLDADLLKKTDEMNTLQSTKLLDVVRDITILTTQKARVGSEVKLIIQNIGDDGLQAQSHDFKPSSFTIPTTCDYCNSTIWGLNKGLTCKACGFNCHTRCEMKVAQNCSQKKGQVNPQPSLSIGSRAERRVSTNGSINSVPFSATSSSSSHHANQVEPPTTFAGQEATQGTMRSIYSYEAQNTDELSMAEGDLLKIVEPDDGTGWIRAQLGNQVGLVPANYIEYLENDHPAETNDGSNSVYLDDQPQYDAPSIVTLPQTSMSHTETPVAFYEKVIALYDFEAVNPEELNLRQGDIIIVTKKEDNGWWEGSLNGQSGVFPANYVGPCTE